jgi:hypothetical protein
MQSEDGSDAIAIAETKLELQKLRDEIGTVIITYDKH